MEKMGPWSTGTRYQLARIVDVEIYSVSQSQFHFSASSYFLS
jgi:hypothetical protein